MRVFAVGDRTENGKVFTAAKIDNSIKTPLNEQLDGLGNLLAKISYVIAGLIIVGRIGMYFVNNDGFSWFGDEATAGFITETLQACMVAVALVAVTVPEGLPMAVTLSLAYSMRAMLKTDRKSVV